jgi:peroxiredoxin
MPKLVSALALIAVIALSAAYAAVRLLGQRPTLPVPGLIHRSKVDDSGHTRGIVQVDLMRQIMASQKGSSVPGLEPGVLVKSQDHPLLDSPAPPLALRDASGKTWKLDEEVSRGPVVVVFYLGSSCMACMTHLVELEQAMPSFRDRGARVLAVSDDTPETSRERGRKFGELELPLLSDTGHAASFAYGVWTPLPGADKLAGRELHGTFIIDGRGLIRWAHLGDRPFTNIEALLAEVDRVNGLYTSGGRS